MNPFDPGNVMMDAHAAFPGMIQNAMGQLAGINGRNQQAAMGLHQIQAQREQGQNQMNMMRSAEQEKSKRLAMILGNLGGFFGGGGGLTGFQSNNSPQFATTGNGGSGVGGFGGSAQFSGMTPAAAARDAAGIQDIFADAEYWRRERYPTLYSQNGQPRY